MKINRNLRRMAIKRILKRLNRTLYMKVKRTGCGYARLSQLLKNLEYWEDKLKQL